MYVPYQVLAMLLMRRVGRQFSRARVVAYLIFFPILNTRGLSKIGLERRICLLARPSEESTETRRRIFRHGVERGLGIERGLAS